MRRHFLWYGIALIWAVAAIIGFQRQHQAQALPALVFAAVFAAVGFWIGKRDDTVRRRAPMIRTRDD